MYVETFLICDAARLDDWGRLHVDAQYHQLTAPGFPAKHDLVLVLVVEWDRGDHGRYDFVVEMLAPDGETPRVGLRGQTEVDARPDDRPRARSPLIQPMPDVVFETPGEYRFRLKAKGRSIDGPRLYLREGEPVDAPA